MTTSAKKTVLNIEAENVLEKHVGEWLNDKASDYDNGVKGVLKDLFHGGCASGFVSDLIYYGDTCAFYEKFKEEI